MLSEYEKVKKDFLAGRIKGCRAYFENNGYYTEENGMITVNYKDYSEPAQKSFCNNDVLAKIILGELVRKSENT